MNSSIDEREEQEKEKIGLGKEEEDGGLSSRDEQEPDVEEPEAAGGDDGWLNFSVIKTLVDTVKFKGEGKATDLWLFSFLFSEFTASHMLGLAEEAIDTARRLPPLFLLAFDEIDVVVVDAWVFIIWLNFFWIIKRKS